MKQIKTVVNRLRQPERISLGSNPEIVHLEHKFSKYQNAIEIINFENKNFNFVFEKDIKKNVIYSAVKFFTNKINLVEVQDTKRKIKNFLINEKYNKCELFRTGEDYSMTGANFYVGISENSIMAFSELDDSQHTTQKVFLGEIPFNDIENIDERNGAISFKEKSSGLYMIIKDLSLEDNILVFNHIRDKIQDLTVY